MKLKRRIKYQDLEAISMSTMSFEFVLHVYKSNDYRLVSIEHRDEMVEEILRIISLENNSKSFPIYHVP